MEGNQYIVAVWMKQIHNFFRIIHKNMQNIQTVITYGRYKFSVNFSKTLA